MGQPQNFSSPATEASSGTPESSGGGGWRRARAGFVSYLSRALLILIACAPSILIDLSAVKPQGHFSKPGLLPRPSFLLFSRTLRFHLLTRF